MYKKEEEKMKKSKYIDHTLLKAFATSKEIMNLCAEANKYDFASVCVNPCNVALAHSLLKDTDVKVCTVIGFPLGANTSDVKAYETTSAIANGADECDMVINIGALKEGNVEAKTAIKRGGKVFNPARGLVGPTPPFCAGKTWGLF